MKISRLSLCGLMVLLAGCGGQPSSTDLADELKACASWATTAQMVGESWLGNTIPRNYARDTLLEAREEIGVVIETARKAGQQNALEALQRLDQNFAAMAGALETQNRATLRAQLELLPAQKERLTALQKALDTTK